MSISSDFLLLTLKFCGNTPHHTSYVSVVGPKNVPEIKKSFKNVAGIKTF